MVTDRLTPLQRRTGFRPSPADADGTLLDSNTTTSTVHVHAESAFHQHEADRFSQADAATQERAKRLRETERKNAELARRRDLAAGRDEARDAAAAAAEAARYARTLQLQEDGGKARRNRSGVPYDPLTTRDREDGGPDGARMRAEEVLQAQRAAARSEVLWARGRSTGFDVLNGAPVQRPR